MPQKPMKFDGVDSMPELVMSFGTMEHNHTGSWRYLRPEYRNRVPPCANRCPAGNDIEGAVRLIEEGRYTDAWLRLKEENPLTRVCGRVCFHPCQTACNRSFYDLPVSINALERFAGEHADRARLPGIVRPPSGKRVAIVGSGPAGLSAATYLARLGHSVVIYEAMPEPGGILRHGIPPHRLPRKVLDDEIEDVESLGVEIRCGQPVGGDGVSFEELSQDYDAVFFAIGAHRSRGLGVPGEDAPQVMSGLALLRKMAAGETVDPGKRAAVIGGGNTAIDAARVLLRLGAEVDIYYRRTRKEMPAFEEELEEAVREGAALHLLVNPARVELDVDGNVRGLTMIRMELGEPDDSGRRRPRPIEGSDFFIEASSVYTCVGELVDTDFLPSGVETLKDGSITVDAFGRSSAARMWAGGDVTPAERTVVDAIGAAKRAAIAIDRYLAGASEQELERLTRAGAEGTPSMSRYLGSGDAHAAYDDAESVVAYEDLNLAHFTPAQQRRAGSLPLPKRVRSFLEVKDGFTEEQARDEVARCFHCGVCNQCDNCYVFCPDVAIHPRAGDSGYDLDLDFCKGCGICAEECPRSSITMVEEA